MNRSRWSRVTLAAALALAIAAFLPAPIQAEDDASVVVSRPGVVFHKAGSSDVRGKGHEKALAEALASGYTPCKVCFGKQLSVELRGAGAAGVASSSNGIGGPPVMLSGHSGPPVSQPFGLRAVTRKGGGAAHAIRNPYAKCQFSMRFPGAEQGAYGG